MLLYQCAMGICETNPEIVIEGEWGSKSGEFGLLIKGSPPQGPESFCVDKEGNIYVLDVINYRIQVFDKEGNIKRILKYDRNYRFPDDLVVDENGNLYLLTEECEFIVFSNMGEPIDSFQIDPNTDPTYTQNANISGHLDIMKDTIFLNLSSPIEIVLWNNKVVEIRDHYLRNLDGISYMPIAEEYDSLRNKENAFDSLFFTPVDAEYKQSRNIMGFYYAGRLTKQESKTHIQFLGYENNGNVVYWGYSRIKPKNEASTKYYIIGNLNNGKVKVYSYTLRSPLHYAKGQYSKCGKDGCLYFMHSDMDKFYIMKIPNAFNWSK